MIWAKVPVNGRLERWAINQDVHWSHPQQLQQYPANVTRTPRGYFSCNSSRMPLDMNHILSQLDEHGITPQGTPLKPGDFVYRDGKLLEVEIENNKPVGVPVTVK